MATQLLTQNMPAPWGGYDTQTPDAQMPANKCRVLQNMLPGRPGRVVMRGPLTRVTPSDSVGTNTASTLTGGWIFNDTIAYSDSKYTPARFRVADFTTTPPSLSAAVTPAGLSFQLYPFHARGGSFVYGYTNGQPGGTTAYPNRRAQNTVSVSTTGRLLYWNGGNAVGDFVLLGATNHPVGAVDIKSFLNRLWVLGGSIPGVATPVSRTNLYYSIDLGNGSVALPDAVTSWQTGGTVNQISLEGSGSDYGVAMGMLNGRLIILRRQSIYMMTGTSPATFQIRKIAAVGCVDPGSIQEWDDGIFFLSDTGYMFFDGVSVRSISAPIADDLQNATWQALTAYEMSVIRISSEYLLMTAQVPNFSDPVIPKSWIYHVPTQSWSTFTADANVFNRTAGTPLRVMRTVNYSAVFDGVYLYDGSFLSLPEAANAATQTGRDVSGYVPATTYIIPAVLTSRNIRLASPLQRSVVHSIYLEYILQAAMGANITNFLQWQVEYMPQGDGLILPTNMALPGTVSVLATVRSKPKRHSFVDSATKPEVIEMQLRWILQAGAGDFPDYAEIYDSVVRYQTIFDRE